MKPVCRIVESVIDVAGLSAALRGDADGAVSTFVGVVRDHHHGRAVDHLEYHAYPEMAAEELERIATELAQHHAISAVTLVHRIGTLGIGEASVLVAVAAHHRGAALSCCAAAIEAIKRRLPVWKKEFFTGGAEPEWIFGPDEQCASGQPALQGNP